MHIPVLQKEVIQYLGPKPNENFVDCTIGESGHSINILEKNGPGGKILGIDQDLNQIEKCKLQIENFKERAVLICDNFANLKEIIEKCDFRPINGILFDLGMSSWHLDESGRGFSFLRDEPLDMRYDIKSEVENQKSKVLTAETIINEWAEKDIEKILREYGEERFAKNITRKIIEARKLKPIKTTLQLVEIIKKSVPRWYERGRIHPATRTFQALRISVNDELNNLAKALQQTVEILEFQGRLLIISFHSLEDRIVKNFMKEQTRTGLLKILTKKPVRPGEEEIKNNPRARSAKLRAAIKI